LVHSARHGDERVVVSPWTGGCSESGTSGRGAVWCGRHRAIAPRNNFGSVVITADIVNSCVRFVRETRSLRVRSRSRTSSTRATHVEAPYAITTCSSRVRASLFRSSRRSPCRARVWVLFAEPSPACGNAQPPVIQADRTPDAPREHARGTPRGVPTISTCIRVTPTTSRVRFWAARVSACARSRSSDPDFVFLRRIVRARRARTACPSRALGFIRPASVTLPSR
jgi:hypothetical protein